MTGKTNHTTSQLSLSLVPERRIFTVRELNAAVQSLFEGEFRNVWVAGEISGCRMAGSGHTYFSLKDEQSQIKCVLFKGNARFARFKPQDGLLILARGSLEVYEARGEYQLIVELIEPQGTGALQLAFEQLKKKLLQEGLFEAARKKPLPKLPQRIGVVTSPGGAVILDILHVLGRRFDGLHVRLYPALVQGEGSIEQVCAGLRFFSQSGWADIVILARGGGSLEDLWTFNEEAVARAIAVSTIPVVSAIGHETDFTIADFVADCRAPTPSAAAEMVICTRDSLLEQIAGSRAKTLQAIRYRLLLASRDLRDRGVERSTAIVHRALAKRGQRLDDMEYQLRHLQGDLLRGRSRQLLEFARRLQACDLRLRLAQNRLSDETLGQRMHKAMTARLWTERRTFESLHAHLTQLSPLAVLSRGYAIVQEPDGRIIRSSADTILDASIRIRLHQGRLGAVVTSIDGELA